MRDAAIRLRTFFRALATVAAGAGVIAGALGGWSFLTSTPRLAIQDVSVEGAAPVRVPEIEMLSGVRIGENLIAADLSAIRERVEEHPWVARATVTRSLPNRLRVIVAERVPVLVLSLDQLYYVDAGAVPFKPLTPGDVYDFPVLVGLTRTDFETRAEWANTRVKDAIRLLNEAVEQDALTTTEISEIAWGAYGNGNGFTVTTVDRGLLVHVGHGDYEKKFRRLARVRDAGGTAHARRVDLRFESRVVVAP